jgi:hypothetical protein
MSENPELNLRPVQPYPLYADYSDPSNTTGRAHIRFGPKLLRLSKEELKSITEVGWEWNNYKKLRRPCGLGVVHFGKEVLDVKVVFLEIKKAKDSQHGPRGGKGATSRGSGMGALSRLNPKPRRSAKS